MYNLVGGNRVGFLGFFSPVQVCDYYDCVHVLLLVVPVVFQICCHRLLSC